LHYPIGIFLIAFGLTSLLASLLSWDAHHKELVDYLGKTVGSTGAATPLLLVFKAGQVLMVLVALAGVLRRRDVWLLPSLFGWIAGFAFYAVLDVWSGSLGDLVEHGGYLVAFTILLVISYSLGVKVRVGRQTPSDRQPRRGGGPQPRGLSRTQEIALAALNRWQRQQPQQQPPPYQGPPPGAQPY
jgi:hypothetical protein